MKLPNQSMKTNKAWKPGRGCQRPANSHAANKNRPSSRRLREVPEFLVRLVGLARAKCLCSEGWLPARHD